MAPLLLKTRVVSYLKPLQVLAVAIFAIFHTILIALVSFDIRTFTNPSRIRHLAYAKTWLWYFAPPPPQSSNPADSLDLSTLPSPLIDLLTSPETRIHGSVLEVGPGTGPHLPLYNYNPSSSSSSSTTTPHPPPKITHITTLEPCLPLHPALRANVKKANLQDICTITSYTAEEYLNNNRNNDNDPSITEGTFDTIVCILVLCSLPSHTLTSTIHSLHALLRKGGRLVVREHVASQDPFSKWVQRFYSGFSLWPWVMDGCVMTLDTERVLREAVGWGRVELKRESKEGEVGLFPHVSGWLEK